MLDDQIFEVGISSTPIISINLLVKKTKNPIRHTHK